MKPLYDIESRDLGLIKLDNKKGIKYKKLFIDFSGDFSRGDLHDI